ncbi:hypothetical protein BT69DRAFT_1315042 [Atractiella rhizophila]|nr:hypothetical protein BT69DRAFT_1315042 [Atractiella rhizophila]
MSSCPVPIPALGTPPTNNIFYSSAPFQLTVNLPFPAADGLALLQNPFDLISLNPLATPLCQTDDGIVVIKDDLPIVGSLAAPIFYTAKFTNKTDGIETLSDALGLTYTQSTYTITPDPSDPDNASIYSEDTTITAIALATNSVLGTVKDSHTKAAEDFKNELVKRAAAKKMVRRKRHGKRA